MVEEEVEGRQGFRIPFKGITGVILRFREFGLRVWRVGFGVPSPFLFGKMDFGTLKFLNTIPLNPTRSCT